MQDFTLSAARSHSSIALPTAVRPAPGRNPVGINANRLKAVLSASWVATFALVAGCDATGTSELPQVELTTYHADVRPLLEQHCIACHTTGGAGPFALDDYASLDAVKTSVVDAVEQGRMPPWRQDPACRPAQGASKLTENEKAIFSAWAAADFVAGDPATFVAPANNAAALVRAPDLIVAPPLPYIPRRHAPR